MITRNSYTLKRIPETHTHIDTEGFQHALICRPISNNNRHYGGLALLIRKTLRSGIKFLKNSSSEFQWVKLLKEYFSLDKDIFLCFSYISPCSFQNKSDSDSFEAIKRDINIFKNDGNIFICGDLNARTGLDPDFIVNDSDKHVPLDPSYIIDSNILQRHSEDTKVDERGKQVIELCISSRMRILNGRILGGSLGKFTCQKSTGASIADYMLASEELLKDVIYFHVHPFQPIFSDCHSKISVCIKASVKHRQCIQNKNEHMPNSFKWNINSSERFIKALEAREISNKINLFMERKFNCNETDVQNACDLFEKFVLQAATKSLIIKRSNKVKKKCNKWYDEELYVKRRLLNSKANLIFNHPFNVSLRNSYFKHIVENKGNFLNSKGKITQKIFLLNKTTWK